MIVNGINSCDIALTADELGFDFLSRKCMEEMGELIQALNNFYRFVNTVPFTSVDTPSKFRTHVIDDIADLQIIMWQLSYLLDAGSEILDSAARSLQAQVDNLDDYSL